MAVTLCVGDDRHDIPQEDAAMLARELAFYAEGRRGTVDHPAAARTLATSVQRAVNHPTRVPIQVDDPGCLDALHAVLNTIVHEPGPAMKLFGAVSEARSRAA